ncbi:MULTISPECIES: hypothetical protein [unclassified Pseudovibrio]|uniref:hypothetical protein n=1 Tax=unclassified Pseudovibrio TaxID=2627060 RepID=UPI0007B20F8A|nr:MULTISPECIES: hypothetical protein [unclassified Pseudovibrio]KZL14964.1 hypothetical protein PsAD37_04497 [Pseudovibrio sp. Ad37]KZL22978.1 hypothetical protein PsWM33_03162 [Pseudovibrio sp. WM33]
MATLFDVDLVPDLSVLWSGEDFDFWQFAFELLKVCDDCVTAVALCQLGCAKVWSENIYIAISTEAADFAVKTAVLRAGAYAALLNWRCF